MDGRLPQPYTAYLRVYEPLDAYSGTARSWWEAYAGRPGRPSRTALMVKEQLAALGRAASTPPIVTPAQESRDAYVLTVEDVVFVCPREDRLRAVLALSDLRAGLSPTVVDSFLLGADAAASDEPEGGLPGVAEEEGTPLAAGGQASGGGELTSVAPHILTSTWHVPARWFITVSSQERTLEPFGPDRSCLYRTRMVEARRRVARSLRVLRREVDGSGVTDGLEDLGRWLEEFHPDSWIELDYGGLARLFPPEQLEADDSPSDIVEAVGAIGRGNEEAASVAYERLVLRWEQVRRLERAS